MKKPIHLNLTPEEFKALQRQGWSEAQFLDAVLQEAKLRGWRAVHFDRGKAASGRWLTVMKGDGKGFPDVVALRTGILIVAELKVPPNRTNVEQEAWLAAFQQLAIAAGVHLVRVFVWTPDDWPEIEEVFK